jgi:hypothetical protein
MLKSEKIKSLKALAKLYPIGGVDHIFGRGLWKNPLNPNSRGIRWTRKDLELFRYYQSEISGIPQPTVLERLVQCTQNKCGKRRRSHVRSTKRKISK